MKDKYKLPTYVASLIVAGFGFCYAYDEVILPKILQAKFGSLDNALDGLEKRRSHFHQAASALHDNPTLTNAAGVEQMAAYYFSRLLGAGHHLDRTEQYKSMVTKFNTDIAECKPDLRRVSGDNEYINTVVQRMEQREEIGMNLGWYGSTHIMTREKIAIYSNLTTRLEVPNTK